ncbi:MAG TPA: four helix bundle protein [Gemmatimonadales bacterium]|nr:four helix bundle protein [Gemmatimonadales bacterium]
MGHYSELKAWRAAHELAVSVYRLTADWDQRERYGLTAQVRRAAFSVPVNIVEGSRRRGRREFRHFLDVAVGSLAEVEYTLKFAVEVGVGRAGQSTDVQRLIDEAGRLCFGLARSLDRPPSPR